MPSVVTPAIVLHAFDYSESSRIVRLATREGGVQSVLARGARRSQKRFGGALDLFAEGEAQFEVKPGRDLHTLARFDVQRGRRGIGEALARFEGATAFGEVMLRVAAADDANAVAYDALADGLDAIAQATDAPQATLRATWRLLAALGYAPALEQCVHCGEPLPADAPIAFAASVGGGLCAQCARRAPTRQLPPYARAQLATWLWDDEPPAGAPLAPGVERAHRRLLHGFVHAHLTDGKPLRAFDAWARSDDDASGGAGAADGVPGT
jgi:DNA repair protein RecO (recombination protein O)